MKRLPVLCGLLAAGLALTAVPPPARTQEFLGKPMPKWLADLAPSKSVPQRRAAAFALGKIGKQATDALKDLLKSLNDTDAGVREAAAFSIGEICGKAKMTAPELLTALCDRLKSDKDALVRRSAAFALGNMEQGNPVAQAALNGALKDDNPAVRQNVAWALGRMGDGAVASLRQALKDADPLVCRDAANSVSLLSEDAAVLAKSELLLNCDSKDVELRKAAVAALVRLMDPDDKEARGRILPLLKDASVEVRRNAALALAGIGGKESAPAVPVLLEALQNADIALKRQAALAFKGLGPDAAEAIPELRKTLKAADEELRMNTVVAFIGFNEVGGPVVPDLLAVLADKKETAKIRAQAAVAVSRICRENLMPALKDGMPTVLRIIGDRVEVPVVRERAMWPIRVFLNKSEEREPVYKALLPILDEPRTKDNKMLRYDCAYILGVFQEAATPEKALDVLLEFLKDPEIKIYAGGSSGLQGGGGERKQEAGKGFKETGVDDGRIMAVDALTRVGVERLGRRLDIVAQLRALHNDPRTLANLKKGLDKLVPELK